MKTKSKPEVIVSLNIVLADERAFQTQFLIHAAKLKTFGFSADKLSKFYEKSAERIEKLVKRILFLGGEPSFETEHQSIVVGNEVVEILFNDEVSVCKGIANCITVIDQCSLNKDFGTAKLFYSFIKEYEEFLYELEILIKSKEA